MKGTQGSNPGGQDELFMTAVYDGNLEKIKDMVEKGADVNAVNSVGCTALMLAGNIGRPDIMDYLERQEATILTKTIQNSLAVSVPIQYGYIDVIQFYINHGVNLNAWGMSGQTALHRAVQISEQRVTPEKKRALLELLLHSGARDSLNMGDNQGFTPLMMAVQRQDLDTMKWLIAMGADITLKNKKGQDALAMANASSQQDMVNTLQYEFSKKSRKTGSSYEILINKLLHDMGPVIEDMVTQRVKKEFEKYRQWTTENKQESSFFNKTSFFAETLTRSNCSILTIDAGGLNEKNEEQDEPKNPIPLKPPLS